MTFNDWMCECCHEFLNVDTAKLTDDDVWLCQKCFADCEAEAKELSGPHKCDRCGHEIPASQGTHTRNKKWICAGCKEAIDNDGTYHWPPFSSDSFW